MSQREEIAVGKFREGYNCAQSVLFSLKDRTGLSEDASLRIATGFGSGMGRTQHVCGAVSGAILALNLLYGRGKDEGKEKQEEVYSMIQTFIRAFEEGNGTIECRELLDGCHLLSEAGQKRFLDENMFERCCGYIARAAGIMDELLERS